MISLSVSAILPASPVHSPGRRTEKSPFLKATRVFSNSFAFSESEAWVCERIVFPSKGYSRLKGAVGAQRFVVVKEDMSGHKSSPGKQLQLFGRGYAKRLILGESVRLFITRRAQFCKPHFRMCWGQGGTPCRQIHHCKVKGTDLNSRWHFHKPALLPGA